MKQSVVLLTFSAGALFAGTADDWAGRSGFQLLNRPFGVSTISRGETGTALHGSFSRWYNPALYGADSGYSVEFEFSPPRDISGRTSAAFDLGVRTEELFVGFEGSNHVEDAGYAVDDFGNPVVGFTGDQLKWQSSEFAFTIGRKRTKWLTWAGTLGTAFEQIDGETAYAVTLGAGFHAHWFDDRLLLGLSAINWGLTTPMINTGPEEFGMGESLPSKIRMGAAWNQPLKSGRIAVAADAVYHHTYDTTKSVLTDMGDRVSFPLGIEYSPVKWVDLRGGHEISGGSAKANFGAGVNTPWVDADLGFVVNKFGSSTELNWMAGVKFHLNQAKPKIVDPYESKKRAYYRPAATVNPKNAIDDFAAMADSAKVEPTKVEPAKVEPAKVEPAKVEPAKVEPAKVEPAKVEPAKVEPAKVEPAKVEPAKVENSKSVNSNSSQEEELGLE